MGTGNDDERDRREPAVLAVVIACVIGAVLTVLAYALITWLL